MPIPVFSNLIAKIVGRFPLRTVLVVPFVVQIVGTVGLVGYLSFKSGQESVEDLARQLMSEKADRIVNNLDSYFKQPKTLVRENQAAIKLGILDWQNTSLMEAYFVEKLNIHTDIGGVMITTESKDFLAVGHPQPNQLIVRQRNQLTGALENYAADLQGNRLYLQDTLANYDPHADPPTNPWYDAAKVDKDGFWQPVVSLVRGKDYPILMMAYFLRFVDSQGEFQGVLSTSIHLDRLGEFLGSLRIGKTGQAFIVDEKGLLIATSTNELPFRQDLPIEPKETLSPEILRLALQDSQNPVTQAAAAWSLNQTNSLGNDYQSEGFRLQNKQYFGQVISFKLDDQISWKIVVVVPESDFMGHIHANTRTTILLCIAALVGSITVGILTAGWITKPIVRLNNAAQAIAKGEWEKVLEINRTDEVGQLGHSFNQMAARLQGYCSELQASNKSLVESESKLNQIIEAIPVGMSIHDISGKLIYANEKSRNLLGIEALPEAQTQELAVAFQVYQSGTEQLYPVEALPIVRAIQGEKSRVNDLEIHLPDRIVPLETYGTPLFDQKGKIVAAMAVFTDITEQKQTEQFLADYNCILERQIAERTSELARTNEQLQREKELRETIYNESTDALFLVNPESLRIVDCNFRAVELFEVNGKEELIGIEGRTLQRNDFTPEELDEIVTQMYQKGFWSKEIEYLTRQGKPFWGNIAAKPIQIAGEVVHLVRVTDINERKLAEQALQESKYFIEQIANNSPQLLYLFDLSTGSDLYINRQSLKILGYTPEEILQRGSRFFLDVLHPDDFSLLERNLKHWETAVDGEILTTESRFRRKDGSWCWLLSQEVVFARDENNRVIKILGTSQDISDRKQIELQLQKAKEAADAANQAKSTFLANMSHELRTPLNAILGFAQLLNSSTNLSPNEKTNLKTILSSGEHLLYLINDVLDLAKIEAGRTTLNEQNFDVHDLLEDIEQMFRLKAQEKGLQFIVESSPDIPQYICTDPGKLRQILLNLLSNAIKFTSEGGVVLRVGMACRDKGDGGKAPLGKNSLVVDSPSDRTGANILLPDTITSRQDAPTTTNLQASPAFSAPSSPHHPITSSPLNLHFQVKDTGAGIAAEELNSIFEAFVQSQTGRKSEQGTGLGLAISRQFAQLMGGDLTASSEVGKGSVFELKIPVQEAEGSDLKTAQQTRLPLALAPNQPCYRLLIVDDQENNRQLLIQLLSPFGFELKQAGNGQEAIAIWQEFAPHLIFMDLRMPVMNGYEATQQIKSTLKGQATAIIAVTASAFENQSAVISAAGCDDVIGKPFRHSVIFAALEKHLGVHYIFEEVKQEATVQKKSGEALTPADLKALPPEILAALEQGTVECDLEVIEEVIEAIAPHHQELASELRSLAANIEYHKILNLIKKISKHEYY